MLRAIGDAGEYILALRRSAGGLLIGNRSVGVLDDFIAVSVPHVDTMGEMFAILHRPQLDRGPPGGECCRPGNFEYAAT